MDKVAALSDVQRSELFEETARERGILPAIIEKDFWVCWVLKKLFAADQLANNLVFKGGTSLSKVYGLIHRFSEDIDLVLNWELLGYGNAASDAWEEMASNTKQNQFNELFNQRAANYIQETLGPQIEQLLVSCSGVRVDVSESDPHVIDVHYPASFHLNVLRPEVKLEIGPLASWVPSAKHIIQPYAAEVFGELFDDPNCPLVAITAERTFWEKATILHQQAHRTKPMPPGYSRHYYDLIQLAASPVKDAALGDLQLLSEVVKFKRRFYLSAWAKYEEAVPGTFRLLPTGEGSQQLEADYQNMQAMFFETPPAWQDILRTLHDLESEINSLS
jgi:hypothetical protein